MLRLLCVTAHPDDEAGGFGGSLLLANQRGIETYIICLTPGQAARNRGNTTSNEELIAARRAEFAASCRHLRATRGEVLDYPDGQLQKQNFYEVVRDLALRMREIRPQVVMSFGPEGSMTAHPDHAMASLFTSAAFQWAARSDRFTEPPDGREPWAPQKLYYRTSEFTLPDRQPVALPPITARIQIGPDLLERKIEAFKMHTTQSPLFPLFERNARRQGAVERFHLAASRKPQDIQLENDLFLGVEDAG
ncbi:MAG: PIG-L family deacetylase [Candidatus Korobacteraceae bacterium]|jgi:LmbE family N-acetylglucosaminyl deacetylase